MEHFVYLLVPVDIKINWIYVGYTNNPEARHKLHNIGRVTSTRLRRPFTMYVIKQLDSKKEATDYERLIKKSSAKKRKFITTKEYLDILR